MNLINIYFYSATIVISAFIGAMASTIWNEIIMMKKGAIRWVVLLLFYLLFLTFTFLIIFLLLMIGGIELTYN